MTQKHTPEPWITDEGKKTFSIENLDKIIGRTFAFYVGVEEAEANAARIVACVNEFAGKSNEEVKGYVEAMDAMYKNYCNLQAENILLKEQIEKLKEGK